MEVSTSGLLDVLLMCGSWRPIWVRFPIEFLLLRYFGRRVECVVLNGAYFYEFDRVDNSRI